VHTARTSSGGAKRKNDMPGDKQQKKDPWRKKSPQSDEKTAAE
jgi:hypothetical protein